jgi:hypothetical protein
MLTTSNLVFFCFFLDSAPIVSHSTIMEDLRKMLRQCSKESLEEAMENVCELLQVVAQGKLKDVKRTEKERTATARKRPRRFRGCAGGTQDPRRGWPRNAPRGGRSG